MGKFVNEMVSLGIEGISAYSTMKKSVEKIQGVLERLLSGNEEVPVEEFLKMYDTRIHNFDSKQDDIKLIKQIDFEGVFIIHNLDDDIYHIGKSEKVLRKIYRYFTGYEREDIYQEWLSKVPFAVRIVKFDNSGYSNIDRLVSDLHKQYGFYEHKTSWENKSNKSKKQKTWKKRDTLIFVLIFAILLSIPTGIFLKLGYEERKGLDAGKINPGYYRDLIGEDCEDVYLHLEEAGFTNIEMVDLNDAGIMFWKNQKVEEISIDGNTSFDSMNWFDKNAKVIVKYH